MIKIFVIFFISFFFQGLDSAYSQPAESVKESGDVKNNAGIEKKNTAVDSKTEKKVETEKKKQNGKETKEIKETKEFKEIKETKESKEKAQIKEKSKSLTVEKKENVTVKIEKVQRVPEILDAGDDSGGMILTINEGDFKYQRIPGYVSSDGDGKKSDSGDTAGEEIKNIIPDKIEIQDLKGKQSSGPGRESGSIFAKLGLALLIIIIFVIYRIRLQKGGNKISRRYTK